MRSLLKFYSGFWSNLWLQEKTSVEVFRRNSSTKVFSEKVKYSQLQKYFRQNFCDIEKTFIKLLQMSFSRRLPHKSSIKSQFFDTLQSIAKLTCLSDKTSREVFSGIFENFSNSKLSQYLKRKTSQDVLCIVEVFLREFAITKWPKQKTS